MRAEQGYRGSWELGTGAEGESGGAPKKSMEVETEGSKEGARERERCWQGKRAMGTRRGWARALGTIEGHRRAEGEGSCESHTGVASPRATGEGPILVRTQSRQPTSLRAKGAFD